MRFSDRIGVTVPQRLYQSGSIDDALRNRLWNKINAVVFSGKFISVRYHRTFDEFFKIPDDETGIKIYQKNSNLRERYFELEWHEIYNFVEFIVKKIDPSMAKPFNWILEEEKSAYRFINRRLVPISDATEIGAVSAAANLDDKFSGAREHIRRALEAFSQKPNADYSNAIKEAISAVESIAKVISGKDKATLGEALGILDQQKQMHAAFRDGLNKLYGYASDEGGIRHASLDDNIAVDESDAHFMIVVCSAFVNFAVSRYK